MKHLVLGSSGQIGTHLLKILRANNQEVVEFDLVRNSAEDLRLHNNILLDRAITSSDFVHFLAFDVGGAKYMSKYQHSYDFINNNMLLMTNTFSLLKKYNKPFIFASSQMSNMLHSPYGVLKSIGESYTASLKGIIVKFWNVYGYEKDPEKTHVITDFIKRAREERQISMMTDGQEERQFLYGDDAAKCLLMLAQNYDQIDRSKLLHITNFQWTKIIDIAHLISHEFSDCQIIPGPGQDNIQQGFRNEPDRYILQFWQPETSLEAGIKLLINTL